MIGNLLPGAARAGLVTASASAIVLLTGLPASAQWGAPTRYGDPYAPPRAERRALDGTYSRSSLKDQPQRVVHVRPSIWQGLYIGGHGGYGFGAMSPVGTSQDVELSGGVLGVHAGYNAQMGQFVLGLEADGTWSDVSGTRNFGIDVTGRNTWLSSVRLRAGYAFDNVLLYATAGAAAGGFDVTLSAGGLSEQSSRTSYGFVWGGGVEMKFNQNWSGRLEALHYDFADKSFEFTGGSLPVDSSIVTIRAGLTYHF